MSGAPDRAEGAAPHAASRVAVVTGAGQGIGRVFATALAEAGHRVAIAERNAEAARRVAAGIGAAAIAVETDVADEASTLAMAASVERAFGRIDILVNNAAVFSTLEMRGFEHIPLAEWEEVLRVNTTGPFLASRAVLPAMRRAGFGRIVHMASAAVTMGRPGYLHYIASKAALVGMARSMARELGADGITVNAILPGATTTEIPRRTVTPAQKAAILAAQCIPRGQVPGDLVGALLFLVSDAAGFVTGQTLTVDGGATHG